MKPTKLVLLDINDDFPPGFIEALGRCVVEFGRLEYLLKACIKSLLKRATKPPPGGLTAFLEGMAEAEKQGSFGNVRKKAEALAQRDLPEPHRSTFVELLERAEVLGDERNDNVHALWNPKGGEVRRYRPYWDRTAKDLRWRNKAVTPAELDALTAQLRALSEDLRKARIAWG